MVVLLQFLPTSWLEEVSEDLETGHDIVDVLVGESGPRSDQSLVREQQSHFSEDQTYGGDKGYQGVPRTRIPLKKLRKRELSVD